LSGIVAKPENKTVSLTTRTVSSKLKRTFAIHGSDSGFSDRLFMLEEPAFGLLVRTVGRRPPIFFIAPSHGTP
jgi:hypothetical protein